MQEASPEERIQALRQLRQRTRGNSAEGSSNSDSRRRRFSARLQTALLGRDWNGSDASRSATPTPAPGVSASTLPEQEETGASDTTAAGTTAAGGNEAATSSTPPRINVQIPTIPARESDESARAGSSAAPNAGER